MGGPEKRVTKRAMGLRSAADGVTFLGPKKAELGKNGRGKKEGGSVYWWLHY